MKYCSDCGYSLTLGTEKYCPNCGQSLINQQTGKDAANKSINISSVQGDVIGAGVSGNANIIGKDIGYTLMGNAMNVHVGSLSADTKESLKKLITTVPIKVESESSANHIQNGDKKNKETKLLEETNDAQKQIRSVLDEVNNIEKASGEKIQEINAGDLQISRDYLLLNDIILKGNEQYYKKRYDQAIRWYNEALRRDPGNLDGWLNKGTALMKKGNYKEAELCFENCLKINPFNPSALNNRAYSLAEINRTREALPIAEKALQINPHNAAIVDTYGFILYKLGRFEEALTHFDRSLEMEENYVRWKHRADVTSEIGQI